MEIEVKMRREKGITLIALVVTIIVLLILAGVSISMLTGQNGILKRAGEVKTKTEEGQAEEELKLAITSLATEYYASKTRGTLKDYIYSHKEDLKKELGTTEVELDESGSTIKYKGNMYSVTEEGEITAADGVALSKTKMTLVVEGETMPTGRIKATLINVTGAISWTSSNTSVATVESTGEEVTVTAVGVGTTIITATCGKDSKTCEVKVAEMTPNPEMDGVAAREYYGQEIDYGVNLDGDTSTNDWKILYNDGINVYIIASDYVPNTHAAIPTTLGMSVVENYTYNLYWSSGNSTKAGGEDIFGSGATEGTKKIANRYLKTWKGKTTISTSSNAQMTAALMDTVAWSRFAEGVEGAYAMGGPTLEMWVASWNEKHGDSSSDETKQQLYCNNATTTGYYVGTTDTPTSTSVSSSIMSATTGYGDTLYYPHTAAYNNCYGYWLASPSACHGNSEVYVRCNGSVDYDSCGNADYGVRPVVCLPSGIRITHSGEVWHIGE